MPGPSFDYQEYADAVLEGAVAFYQVCETVFVVQGWNLRVKASTVRLPPYFSGSASEWRNLEFFLSPRKAMVWG